MGGGLPIYQYRQVFCQRCPPSHSRDQPNNAISRNLVKSSHAFCRDVSHRRYSGVVTQRNGQLMIKFIFKLINKLVNLKSVSIVYQREITKKIDLKINQFFLSKRNIFVTIILAQ